MVRKWKKYSPIGRGQFLNFHVFTFVVNPTVENPLLHWRNISCGVLNILSRRILFVDTENESDNRSD